jgi:hypothetical protein
MLSNDVLLEIFDWCLDEDEDDLEVDAWYPLVHICRNWRNIIFSSSRRLNLRLFYTAKPGKPAWEMLGVWPAFPIIIQVNTKRPWSVHNVIAALEHKDRIRKIQLVDIEDMDLKPIFSVMQEPFPTLTDLLLTSSMWGEEVPDSLLGEIAPRLRSLKLDSISYPGLSNLVWSSARDLVELSLLKVPSCEDMSPKTMATALSALTRLETLSLAFEIDDDASTLFLKCPTKRKPTSPTRSVLPSLKFCLFQGICGYLEDFVAMIDTPRLEILDITLALCQCNNDSHPLRLKRKETPQFNQFLGRTEMFKTLNNASIRLWSDKLEIAFSRKPWACDAAKLTLKIMCKDKIYILGRVCITDFLPLSNIESLGISSQYHKWQSDSEANEEDIHWPYSLFRFSAVKSLYLPEEIIPSVACGMKRVIDLEGKITLPPMLRSLQEISTDTVKPLPPGSVKTVIEKFAAMRGLSARDPPTIPFCWVANERNANASDL